MSCVSKRAASAWKGWIASRRDVRRRTVSIEMDSGAGWPPKLCRATGYVDRLEEAEWDFSEFLNSASPSFGPDM